MIDVHLVSTSNAGDNGFRALRDLSIAAEGLDYRVIGGHMVQILMHVYPTPLAQMRGTSDADGGIGAPVAAGLQLHERLLERGYRAEKGNHYELGEGEDAVNVDLLVPGGASLAPELHGGRSFDVAPGLALAMNSEPILVNAEAHLSDSTTVTFAVPVPSVECAVVMKTLVRRTRILAKDVADLASLLEAAALHRESGLPWTLNEPARIEIGARLDTARELYSMAQKMENGVDMTNGSGVRAVRLSALIRNLVAEPK